MLINFYRMVSFYYWNFHFYSHAEQIVIVHNKPCYGFLNRSFYDLKYYFLRSLVPISKHFIVYH